MKEASIRPFSQSVSPKLLKHYFPLETAMTGLVVKELVGWFNYSLIVIGRERIGLTARWIAE